jgi:multiple antibiotic resistance protein
MENTLYFLALINPASKILLLASLKPRPSLRELTRLAFKSSVAALIILVIITCAGKFLFEQIFRVEIYSLKIAGGVVLFAIGWKAVREGVYYNQKHKDTISDDFAIVPLASPLIAGPGLMTAAISFGSDNGLMSTLAGMAAALFMNFLLMLLSGKITETLEHLHIIGAVIRISGLIVAAVSVQMLLNGIAEWMAHRLPDLTGKLGM